MPGKVSEKLASEDDQAVQEPTEKIVRRSEREESVGLLINWVRLKNDPNGL
jgi:hypothetical protein